MPVLKPQELIDERVAALRQAHIDANQHRAELDLSGGIDSAVMAGLLVLALGPDRVTLVHSRFKTNPAQTDRAVRLGLALGCPAANCALGGAYEVLMTEFKNALNAAGYDIAEIKNRMAADPTIEGSIRSTLRAPIGRALNRMTGGGLRHGTGNECEDRFLRFYQKGGDGEVDSNPIAMLTKGEVYQLALALTTRLPAAREVLLATIAATPSPDLWGTGDGHSDEAELLSWTGAPFTYSRISVETGEYVKVGTIERVARFLDVQSWGACPISSYLFGVNDPDWPDMVAEAKSGDLFNGFTDIGIETLLRAARKVERTTRHKLNPNIPMYGDRKSLVEAGIITDTLPVV